MGNPFSIFLALLIFASTAYGYVQINFYWDSNCGEYAGSTTIQNPTDDYKWNYNGQSALIANCEISGGNNHCTIGLSWTGHFVAQLDADNGHVSSCAKTPIQEDGLSVTDIQFQSFCHNC
jgi:hypothetical protein